MKTLDSFSASGVDFQILWPYTVRTIRATKKEGIHYIELDGTATRRERNPKLVDTGVQYTPRDLSFDQKKSMISMT